MNVVACQQCRSLELHVLLHASTAELYQVATEVCRRCALACLQLLDHHAGHRGTTDAWRSRGRFPAARERWGERWGHPFFVGFAWTQLGRPMAQSRWVALFLLTYEEMRFEDNLFALYRCRNQQIRPAFGVKLRWSKRLFRCQQSFYWNRTFAHRFCKSN